MSDAERLARAVLLFHWGGPWTAVERVMWKSLTGEDEATTRALCDLARVVGRSEEERRADGLTGGVHG